ncbi:MAG: sulfatase-like hydrolase/transferase [Bacteroides sp.]|nr:sulfatase-like hydrolase/transferase [Bacteroides sp.]
MRKRKLLIYSLFASVFLLASACGGDKTESKPRPNIILCMADDLGWGDVGYNGHPYIQTPSLDEMAESGIRFDRFYSGSSVCSPTRGSCLTGRNPFRYGIPTANKGHLKKEELTLAEVMKELGYSTGHFGKWHLGALSPEFSGKGPGRRPEENYMTPGMAGFDEWFATEFAVSTYDPYNKETAHTKAWSEKGDWRSLYWHNGNPLNEELEGCDSKIIMDKAIPFIESSVEAGTPFFTVIWFHAPHAPVVGHPEYMEKLYSDRPENEQHFFSVVTAVDVQMGRLREKLRELGVEENTLLCFTSDNGPEGNPGKTARHQGSAGDFRGRKRSLYEGGIRVPGIIEFPSRFEGGKVVNVPCVTSDYFPTIVDLLGYELEDKDRPYDGISMLPFLEKEKKQREKGIGFQWGQQRAWTGDRYKLVQNLSEKRQKSDNGMVPVEEFELYDLLEDPGETINIASKHPDILKTMKKELAAFVSSCENSLAGADYSMPAK